MKRILAAFFVLGLTASCTQRSTDGTLPNQPAHTSSDRLMDRDPSEALTKSDCDEQRAAGGMISSDCQRYEDTRDAASDRDRPVDESVGGR